MTRRERERPAKIRRQAQDDKAGVGGDGGSEWWARFLTFVRIDALGVGGGTESRVSFFRKKLRRLQRQKIAALPGKLSHP